MLTPKRLPVSMYRLIYSRMRPHLLPIHNPRDSPTSLSASGSSSLAIKASPVLRIGSEKDVGMATTRILIPSSIEEISRSETKPFIQRTFSYTQQFSTSPDSSPFQQKRRRRSASDNSLSDLQSGDGGHSFQQNVGRDASDAYVITRLSLTLLRYLGLGYRWVSSFLALGCYSLFILPGIVQVGYQYFFSKQIRRGIVYGDQPRNKLDIYLPKNSVSPKPVIAFVTGGAWIIGYKAWGSLLGLQLLERDIIVVCIDYRNFPQGTISHMIQDASEGISFICNHIAEYGGDPERIYLMGQSAGAHIGACVLLDQAIKEASGERISWSVSQIKSYFGLSGGYNLFNLVDHLNN